MNAKNLEGRRVFTRTMSRPQCAPAEVIVLQTQQAIEEVSSRIERAYKRRRSQWRHVNLDSRVWLAAVTVLVEANRLDPRAPVDPELFVACVAGEEVGSDPWTELTRVSSRKRYISRIRSIIKQLRTEIKVEVCRIRNSLRKGESLETVLLGASRKTTAIARYLVAIKEERADLAELIRIDAQHQHWSCPLYRDATIKLFPAGTYPVGIAFEQNTRRAGFPAFSLN